METLAVIPARGGSKGVPRKNVRLLLGKPLIAWTIEAAQNASTVSRVVVSTDDAEIAQIARSCGASTVMRPAEISGDEASSEAALLHVLDQLERNEQYRPDLIAFLQCTSPLTTSSDIDGVVDKLMREDADCALASVEFHYFVWREDDHGQAVGVNHDATRRLLRQQREPQYLEAGSVYVMRAEGFKKAKHRFFGKTVQHVMPEEHCFEIDNPYDFVVAETLKGEQLRRNRVAFVPEYVSAVIFDFDGVFTDNKVLVTEDGREAVICSRADGLGISQLRAAGVSVLVLSSEENPVVQTRCRKLGIECLNAMVDKLPVLKSWLRKRDLELANVVYVGNDVNDLACVAHVGCGVAVFDAHPSIRAAAKLVLRSKGGEGAIREICDMVTSKTWVRAAA